MFKTNQPKETMTQINDKMDQAIINDDFDQIEKIALDPNYAYVKCSQFNIFNGKLTFINKWINISNVIDQEDYFEDLSSDCQDYVMSLDKYKDMDYDKIIDDYDRPIEKKNNESLKYFEDQIKEYT